MNDDVNWARTLVTALEKSAADTVDLAHLLAPAVRIERALLRAVRLRFLPWSDTGIESDVWFGPLVESRASGAIVLQRQVARTLQERLIHSVRWDYAEVRAYVADRHREAAPILQLEEELFHDTRAGAPAEALERGLKRVLNALTDEHQAVEARLEIARWVQQALPQFVGERPPSALEELVAITSAAYLGLPIHGRGEQAAQANAPDVAWVLPESLRDAEFELGIAFMEGGIRFVPTGADAAETVRLRGFQGIPAVATWDDTNGPAARWISLTPGLEIPLPVDCRQVRLETLADERLIVDAAPEVPAPKAGAAGEGQGQPAVFVIHNPSDRSTYLSVAQALKAAGYETLRMDTVTEGSIPPEHDWQREVEAAISQADLVLVLCSEASQPLHWMTFDTVRAIALGKRVLPVRIDASEPPDMLAALQHVDLDPDSEESLGHLADRVGKRLTAPATFPGQDTEPGTSEPSDVFLSHSHADAAYARQIGDMLESQGLRVAASGALGERGAPDPVTWPNWMERHVSAARIVVLLATRAAEASAWTMVETAWALARNQSLFVAKLDPAFQSARLAEYPQIDLSSDFEGGVKHLSEALHQHLESGPAPGEDAAQATRTERIPPELRERILAFQGELDDEKTEPPRRAEIGDALAKLGDPRPGVGLSSNGLPDIIWQKVPEGPFLYQDGEKLELPTFWMAAYAITNAQYQAFVDDGGYRDKRWWDGLAQRFEEPEESRWTHLNQPRTNVAWYEAIAFCRWLSESLNYEVRLPTEQEWEKAARGEDGRVYPWGNEYRSGYANVDETANKGGPWYLERPTAVGMYPQNTSPYGVVDMAGNVWEWCRNEHENPDRTEDAGDANRVLRGGSWIYVPDDARASFRYRGHPDFRNRDDGFRVCCSSPIPEP